MGVGFVTCVPVGAIGLYSIRKTLLEGRLIGLELTFLGDFLRESQEWIRISGGLIMLALGLVLFLNEPPEKGVKPKGSSLWGYIHVADQADAHLKALDFIRENGITVKEMLAYNLDSGRSNISLSPHELGF